MYYTNSNFYYGITGKDSLIYGATNGGLVRFNYLSGTYTVLTSLDGFRINRQKAVALDSFGYIWSGSEVGIAQVNLDFTTVQNYPVDYLPDTRINTIYCMRDTVIVGTVYGLLRIETKGTPDNFGDDVRVSIYEANGLLSNNVTSICSDDSSIWVGTDNGLVRFNKDFSDTQLYNLSNTYINKIAVFDTNIYVGTNNGLFHFLIDHFDTLLLGSMYKVKDIVRVGDSLLLAMDSSQQIGVYYQGTLDTVKTGLSSLAKVNSVLVIDTTWYCGLGNSKYKDYYGEGVGVYDKASTRWNLIKGNSLASNHISCITANAEGVFVAHGNRSLLSRGFSWLKNNGEWVCFMRDSVVPGNNIHRCVTALDGRVWFGLNTVEYWNGIGAIVVAFAMNPGTGEWTYIPLKYDNMDSTDAIWDIEVDYHDNLFFSLGSQTSDRCWIIDSALANAYALVPKKDGFFSETAIDSTGKIWRTIPEQPGGLVVTDTKNTLFNTSDDEYWVYDSPGNITNNLRGCIVDANNNLFIASPVGLIRYDGSTFTNITTFPSLELFDVELDGEGRVWIMARDGIYSYEPRTGITDGKQYRDLGAYIDFDTLDKEVIQIQGFHFDPLRRCFWLGGETGLLKLEIQIDTLPALDSILVYPNPVIRGGVVRIKNLPSDARINIYSINGRLIAKDLLPYSVFGEVVWTIPDDIGSGLYFALVRSGRGKKICKFAIVK